jgi:RNA polymerase sigma factor (sigma-70 family)
VATVDRDTRRAYNTDRFERIWWIMATKTRKPGSRSNRRQRPANLRKLVPTSKLPSGSVLRGFPAQDVQWLRRRIAEPIECVLDPTFRRSTAERRYVGAVEADEREGLIGANLEQAARRRSGKRSATLTAAQERELFLRFNYFRYRTMNVLRRSQGRRLTAKAARQILYWDRLAMKVRDQIVDANLGLIPTMVERSRITGVDFSELISEGQLALLRSIDKFDCSRGFKFSTYACRAILTSITRAVALMARHRTRFPTEFDPDLQKGDSVETRRATVEADCVQELQELLVQNDADLTQTERQVLSERFGLPGSRSKGRPGPQKTLRQVAARFGVTKERVRQIQNKALSKLRGALDERVFV